MWPHRTPGGSWFEQTWISSISGSFYINFSFPVSVVLEKKIFKWHHPIFAFSWLSPLWWGPGPSIEAPSPKDDVYQVWLNLAQQFLRRSWKCEKFTTTTTTTTTDNGQILIRKAHLSLRLRWAKKTFRFGTSNYWIFWLILDLIWKFKAKQISIEVSSLSIVENLWFYVLEIWNFY